LAAFSFRNDTALLAQASPAHPYPAISKRVRRLKMKFSNGGSALYCLGQQLPKPDDSVITRPCLKTEQAKVGALKRSLAYASSTQKVSTARYEVLVMSLSRELARICCKHHCCFQKPDRNGLHLRQWSSIYTQYKA